MLVDVDIVGIALVSLVVVFALGDELVDATQRGVLLTQLGELIVQRARLLFHHRLQIVAAGTEGQQSMRSLVFATNRSASSFFSCIERVESTIPSIATTLDDGIDVADVAAFMSAV